MLGSWLLSLWKGPLRGRMALVPVLWIMAGCASEGPIEWSSTATCNPGFVSSLGTFRIALQTVHMLQK